MNALVTSVSHAFTNAVLDQDAVSRITLLISRTRMPGISNAYSVTVTADALAVPRTGTSYRRQALTKTVTCLLSTARIFRQSLVVGDVERDGKAAILCVFTGKA
ncbi:hypothetical protein [Sorangium sp. So ce1389]|uniref:hypothetical protein n=1 Tax=Sorangium sp. So ce1389 TaxID=3133336 RepID=UPI003F62C4F7